MEEYNCYVDNELRGISFGRMQAEVDRREFEDWLRGRTLGYAQRTALYVMEQDMQGCAQDEDG